MTTVTKTKQKKTPNLGCEVDEVIGLVGEEEFERRPAQIVAPQVHLLQLAEVPFEIGALAVFAQSGVPEANESSRDFQPASDDGHESHQLAVFADGHFFFPLAQLFLPIVQ